MSDFGPIQIAVLALAVLWFGYRLWSVLGRRSRRVCSHGTCGQVLPRGSKFCPRCGHKVE